MIPICPTLSIDSNIIDIVFGKQKHSVCKIINKIGGISPADFNSCTIFIGSFAIFQHNYMFLGCSNCMLILNFEQSGTLKPCMDLLLFRYMLITSFYGTFGAIL